MMPADFRIIRLAHGKTLRARVVPHIGLGTALDQFYRERGTEPHRYMPRLNSERFNRELLPAFDVGSKRTGPLPASP